MYGGPLTNGFRSNLASSLASGTISVCGVGFASDHPQKEHVQGKSPRLNFLPAASRMKTRSPSRSARSASWTSNRRQMREMMCSMCGFGEASGAEEEPGAGQHGGAAFEEEEDEGSTAVADDADDADESDAPLPLSPPLPLASASPLLGAGGHRASLQSMRSSATRSALQGGRCGVLLERGRRGRREKRFLRKREEGEA